MRVGFVVVRTAGVFSALFLTAGVSGCSTVIKTSSAETVAASAPEHEALAEAAARAAWAPWPRPTSATIADRLVGAGAEEEITRDDAVEVYVASLQSSGRGEAGLLADAGRQLDAARTLTAAAQEACDVASPRLSDVAHLEAAIGDLRQSRTIYVAALKKIDSDDAVKESLKRDFDKAIKGLGDAADSLAENAMKKRTGDFSRRVAGAF